MTSLMKKKKQVLAAQLSELASKSNEDTLYYELSLFFQQVKEQVLHELEEYWPNDDTVLLQGQLDLILAPIFESQQQYYNILRKYNIKEYNLGVKQGRRLVKMANKPLSSFKSESNTIKVNRLANLHVDKDELFGTNDWTQQRLLNQSFTASERTMNRVDQDINKIISDGYKSGDGVNKVAANIENRFNQLKTWESKRIARTEMHNAHQMGIMNIYQDMGVEYTQWTCAHDRRTRDSHKEIDGEIIPLGGTYSNGCQYPGDTNGPIEEWINCRCGNVPFIIPDGYIAPPGMSQFRESDLVSTLDYWNQNELMDITTQETSQISEGNVLEEITRSNEFDIYRLPPDARKRYLNLKKNQTILNDALETKNYNKLDELEPSVVTMIESKATVKELGDDFLTFAKEELEDYALDISDYEKIIKDKNIKVTIEPKGIKWKNDALKDNYYIHNTETGKYHPFNTNEKFVKYHFKKENLTILESVDMDSSRVMHVYEEYKKLPKRLQNTNEIVLSSQKPVKIGFLGSDSKLGGYVVEGKGNRIVSFKKTLTETSGTVIHEATHNLEKDQLYYISNSKEWVLAFKKDQKRLLAQGKELKGTYVTEYSYSFTESALEVGSAANRMNGHKIYSEDLAESMKKYLKNKKEFSKDYPEKAKVLEKILNGEFKPKTTTLYDDWYKFESKRFRLTPKERERQRELKWKQDDLIRQHKSLNSKETKELQYFEDKVMLDFLHNKKIRGESLSIKETKVYRNLTKKWKKKLNLESILNEESINSNKFSFTKEDMLKYNELLILKQEGKLKGIKNKNALKLLENQKKLDSLHQTFIKNGNLSSEDAKEYKKLYNNPKVRKKFKLELLEDTLELEGKAPLSKPHDTECLGDLDNPNNIKEFKGTTKDGMLPGQESIDRYFTKNVTATEKYDEFIEEWVYDKAYKDVQLFDDCGRDIKILRNKLIKSNPSWTSEMIEEAIEEVVSRSNKFDKLMKGAKTKKNMKFYRRQQELNISEEDIKKGETILPSARSVSISKEGATDYVGKAKSYKWELEIEAPAGTNIVYIAPKAKSKKHRNKFIRQMEAILDRDTPCEILEIIDDDVKNIHKVRLRVKG